MRRSISLVIPTRNAGPDFRHTLEMIRCQKVDATVDVLVVDTQSTDCTPDVCREYGVPIISITPECFNHGLTRNLAISKTDGEFVALLVQDAIPQDELWLGRMVHHLEADDRVAGVTGRQVPRMDAEIVARWELLYHFGGMGDGIQIKEISDLEAFRRLPFVEKFYKCSFDTVTSILRRSVWETMPFRQIAFAEDLDWGYRVLKAGYRIVYEPSSVVIHSHDRPAAYHLRRHYVSGKTVPEILECSPADYSQEDDSSIFAMAMELAVEVTYLIQRIDETKRKLKREEIKSLFDSRRVVEEADFRERVWKGAVIGWLAQQIRLLSAALGRVGLDFRSYREQLKAALPLFTKRSNRFREHFYYMSQAILSQEAEVTHVQAAHVALHVLARVLGQLLGDYYYWCRCNNRISPELAGVDAWLSMAV